MAIKPYPQPEEKPMVLGEPAVAYQRTGAAEYRAVRPKCEAMRPDVDAFLEKYKAEDPDWEEMFRPYTMEQVNRRIDAAEANIAAGNVMSGEEFFDELRRDFPWLY